MPALVNGFASLIKPAMGKEVNEYDDMNGVEAKYALEKYSKAFEQWRWKSLEKRGALIKAIGKELEKVWESFIQHPFWRISSLADLPATSNSLAPLTPFTNPLNKL